MDTLALAQWTCGCTSPALVEHPDQLQASPIAWLPASVPGTAASALRAAGRWSWGEDDRQLLDGSDWWFRGTFGHPEQSGPWELELGGIATLADVWLNGEHLLTSSGMFTAHRIEVDTLSEHNELAIRCAALLPRLAGRHQRPRYKSRLVAEQSLRWYRTTLLGRMPGWSAWGAPVGPWRPVSLKPRAPTGTITQLGLRSTCDEDGSGGTVSVAVMFHDPFVVPRRAWLDVAGRRARLELTEGAGDLMARGAVHVPRAERWWPHTHGAQPLYPVELDLDGVRLPLRRVAFRTVAIDRADGGFQIRINGRRCFCRGAVWSSPDPVSLAPPAEAVRESVELATRAGMNMLRLGGFGTYESSAFWDACDERGVMVWQDCMLASVDPPTGPGFVAALEQELRQQLGALQGRPALAVVSGSSETYQQAAMYGLPRSRYRSELLEQTIPRILEAVVPGVPYVASSPSGGEPPFRPDVGVCHYFGVGAYLRPLTDARMAGVRFAAECLSFATPPERETVESAFGGAAVAGHSPRWKATVARDAGTSWDFEDVRDWYVRALFGVDPVEVRYSDPEHALDLGRAAVVEAMTSVLGDWRRIGSRCDGAIVLAWRDLWPGAGWGVLDALGRPKASFYALARIFASRTLWISDDGLAGLSINVTNDGAEPVSRVLGLCVYNAAGLALERAERALRLPAHGQLAVSATQLLAGFRDLNAAYRFSSSAYDVVVAELRQDDGQVEVATHFLPGGAGRRREPDVGLRAQARPVAGGRWALTVATKAFAQYVSVEIPGFRMSDGWFHMAPSSEIELELERVDGRQGTPRGRVRALNSMTDVHVEVLQR